jgi:hypothetical protein
VTARVLTVDGNLGGVTDRIKPQQHPPADERLRHIELASIGPFVNVGEAGRTLPEAWHRNVALLGAGGLDTPDPIQREASSLGSCIRR